MIRNSRELQRYIREQERAREQAEKRAITRTLPTVKKEVANAVRGETTMNRSLIRALIKAYKQFTRRKRKGRVWIGDYEPDLAVLPHRVRKTVRTQPRRGPRTLGIVSRSKPGEKRHIPRAFLIKRGDYVSMKERTDKDSYKTLRAPSLADLFGRVSGRHSTVLQRIDGRFRREFEHQLEYYLRRRSRGD